MLSLSCRSQDMKRSVSIASNVLNYLPPTGRGETVGNY